MTGRKDGDERRAEGYGDLETGLYMEHSGYSKPLPIAYCLSRQASQENCDGDPYDAMQFAAEYIKRLEAEIVKLKGDRVE